MPTSSGQTISEPLFTENNSFTAFQGKAVRLSDSDFSNERISNISSQSTSSAVTQSISSDSASNYAQITQDHEMKEEENSSKEEK